MLEMKDIELGVEYSIQAISQLYSVENTKNKKWLQLCVS